MKALVPSFVAATTEVSDGLDGSEDFEISFLGLDGNSSHLLTIVHYCTMIFISTWYASMMCRKEKRVFSITITTETERHGKAQG